MIVTTFADCQRYAAISPKLKKAFDWLNSNNLMDLPQGAHLITNGCEIFSESTYLIDKESKVYIYLTFSVNELTTPDVP